MSNMLTAAVLLIILALFYANRAFQGARRSLRLPPGPKGSVFGGNASQFPVDQPWIWYTKLKEEHGDIVHLTVSGSHMIILNTIHAVKDLYIKRSSLYSDRPRMTMCGEIIGQNINTFMTPFGDFWRAQRVLWHRSLGPASIPPYHSFLEQMNVELINDVHKDGTGNNIHKTLHSHIVRIMVRVAFGIDPRVQQLEWTKGLASLNGELLSTMAPGRFLVDSYPFLKYIPAWFPGAGWKRYGKDLRRRLEQISEEPYNVVKQSLAEGKAPLCVTTSMLEHPYTGIAASVDCQKWISGTIYGGGVDTTLAVLRRFVLAMTLYPEIQIRAQEELDSITEGRRLPNFQDESSLPYLGAIIKECMRWEVSLPYGVSRRLTQDDEYLGYFLPEGATIVPNIWAITNDVEEYPEPHIFRPERYLSGDDGKPEELDPISYTFGVGRRICPGLHFAQASIFITAAMFLATSTISKPVDAKGVEYEPRVTKSGGFINEINEFECRVSPRSSDRMTLVQAAVDYI